MGLNTVMRVITDRQIMALLTMQDAMMVVRAATIEFGSGMSIMPPKVYLKLPQFNGDFRAMPAYSNSYNVAGVKWVNSHPGNPLHGHPAVRAQILLNDPETATPLALVDGTRITSMRTGATGGVAVDLLARPNAHTIGFVGAGVQSYYQAMAICSIRTIQEIRVYDPSKEARLKFAKEVRTFFSGKLVETNSIQDCVKDTDIIVSTTPSRSPIIEAHWVAPGCHINAIGADAPGKQELDPMLLVNGRIIVDDPIQAAHSGEINVPLQQRILSKRQVQNALPAVLLGQKRGRQNKNQITIFDSTGLAVHDIATAGFVYRTACQKNIGTTIAG